MLFVGGDEWRGKTQTKLVGGGGCQTIWGEGVRGVLNWRKHFIQTALPSGDNAPLSLVLRDTGRVLNDGNFTSVHGSSR